MILGIGVLSNRDWKPKFGISIVALFNYLAVHGVSGHKLEDICFIPRLNCSLPPRGRRLIVDDAVERKCSHLLCIDDDMVFPEDAVDYLARGIGEYAMVCANYHSRSHRGKPVAVHEDDAKGYIYSAGKSGQEEISRCGFGLVLLDIAKVRTLPRPLFAVPWLPQIETELGEDYYFCTNLRKAGHRIAVDHDVSNSVKHIADIELDTL